MPRAVDKYLHELACADPARVAAELRPERTEHARLAAAFTWERSDKPPLRAFSWANLQGRLAYYERLEAGERHSRARAGYKLAIQETKFELNWRRMNPDKCTGAMKQPAQEGPSINIIQFPRAATYGTKTSTYVREDAGEVVGVPANATARRAA